MTIRQALAIERMWPEGVKVTEIAERIGSTEDAVSCYAYSHRDKCPRRPQGRRADESRDKMAARLVDGGATYKAAGEALGVHERTIARMVKRHREREKEDA
jgi:predicted transcriptional regulator